MKKFIVFVSMLFTIHASSQNAIFNGGDGDGYALDEYAEIAGNIFNGGNGDGWAAATILFNLPVHFSYFKADIVGDAVVLKWETASEQNADRFEIERSEDGSDFKNLGKIKSTGAGNVRTTYTFTDRSPFAGDNYYRLKQVDKNGNFIYTPIRLVSLNTTQNLTIAIYPQPAKNRVTIKLPSDLNGKSLILNIINSLGGLERQLINTNNRAGNSIELSVNQLSKGIYFLHIHSGNKVYVSTMVVE